MSRPGKPLLRALAGEPLPVPPWWLMRQAGRYLPEFREVRRRAPDFVALCLNPRLAAELTLQPVRRFGMDAAILFSDILLLPWALGQRLTFREGEGPVLEPMLDPAAVGRLDLAGAPARLAPIFEAASRVAAALPPQTALLGFAGSPWTVATYMVEGGSSRDFQRVKGWAYRDPTGFDALVEVLVEGTVMLLAGQIEAGAEAVQLFDSWAGVLPEAAFERWVVAPTSRIVAALKSRFPDRPIIGFPRGAGVLYERFAVAAGVDAISLDHAVPARFAVDRLRPVAVLQGNLDPVALLCGGAALADGVSAQRQAFAGGAWVFNLGHGILPETPPENIAIVARLLARPAGS
jgi:uroporphyrinogen decarboxylase